MIKSRARFALSVIACLAIVGVAVVLITRRVQVAPIPAPANLAALDPALGRAISETAHAIDQAPNDIRLWNELAMVYHANGIEDPAAACYRRALELDAGQAETWYRLGVLLSGQGRFEEARTALNSASRINPDYAPIHWRLGYLELELGDLAEARRAFEQARTIDSYDPASAFGLAQVCVLERKAEEAIALLEPLAHSRPNDRHVFYLLGQAYRQGGRESDARAALMHSRSNDEGFAEKPDWFDVWSNRVAEYQRGLQPSLKRAQWLLDNDRVGEALDLLVQLTKEYSPDPQTLISLARVQIRAKQPSAALESLRKAHDLNPDLIEIDLERIRALAALNRMDEALTAAEETIAHAPYLVNAHRARAELLVRFGRRSEAIQEFREVLARDARDASVWADLAVIQLELGDATGAIVSLREAIERDSFQPALHYRLAHAFLLAGDADESERSLDAAVELGFRDEARVIALRLDIARLRGTSQP